MRNFFIITLALLSTACGQLNKNHPKVLSVESPYAEYVSRFETEAQNQGTPVNIDDLIVYSITPSQNYSLGDCVTDSSGSTPTIEVNANVWAVLNDQDREELMYHELGHCILGREHRSAVNNMVPVSIMSPGFFGSTVYTANKAQYLYELFHNKDKADSFPMYYPMNALVPSLPQNYE